MFTLEETLYTIKLYKLTLLKYSETPHFCYHKTIFTLEAVLTTY